MGLTTTEYIEFLIVVILYFLTDRSQQTFFFTDIVLSAAIVGMRFLDARHFFDFTSFEFAAQDAVTYPTRQKGNDEKTQERIEKNFHNV